MIVEIWALVVELNNLSRSIGWSRQIKREMSVSESRVIRLNCDASWCAMIEIGGINIVARDHKL